MFDHLEMAGACAASTLLAAFVCFSAMHADRIEEKQALEQRVWRAEHTLELALALYDERMSVDSAVFLRDDQKRLSGTAIRREATSQPPVYYIERWPQDMDHEPLIHHGHSTSLASVLMALYQPYAGGGKRVTWKP